MLTPDLFAHSVEAELRLSGRPFDRAALWAYVASCWLLMLDDPDPVRWAGFCRAFPGCLLSIR